MVSGLLTDPLRKSMIEAKQHMAAYSISTHMMYKNNYKYTKHVFIDIYIYIYIQYAVQGGFVKPQTWTD